MSPSDGLGADMARFDLDADTAERMLRGTLTSEDAPPAYRDVAALFEQVSRPTGRPLPGEQAGVADVIAAVHATPPDTAVAPRRKSVITKAKLAAAGLTGALALTTGLAAANALPGAAQQAASDALAEVGVSVPSPNSHSNGHSDTRGTSADAKSGANSPSGASTGPNAHADFGLCTAAEAHQDNGAQPKATVFPSPTTCSSVVHPGQGNPGAGAAVDAGKPADRGSHGPANKPSSTPPASTPNSGGTSTANTASGGHSSAGTANADQHSGGAASNGSANASSHRP